MKVTYYMLSISAVIMFWLVTSYLRPVPHNSYEQATSPFVAEQIQSIKRVLKLDFEIMFCGHNPQFKNSKPKLQKKLEFFENFYGKVADLYHQGHSTNSIFKEMKLKENWFIRILSTGELSTLNMIKSVIRDEQKKQFSS